MIKKINDKEIEVNGVVHEIQEDLTYKVKVWKRWRAEENEKYFFLDSLGAVSATWETNTKIDDYLYDTGNYFQTAEKLEAKKQFDISSQIIKDSAEGFVGNWKDESQEKFFICFTYNEYIIESVNYHQYFNEIYFETEE